VLILASGSQSRKNLLNNAHIDFIQISSDFDESSITNNNIKDLALSLSENKANSTLSKIKSIEFQNKSDEGSHQLIGCDSIFEFKGKSFGKPLNKKDAFNRWKEMSSRHGYLHTGHTLLFYGYKNNEPTLISKTKEVITTKIYFSKLTFEEIQKYVDTLEPLSCAGGFALEGRGGKLIERIEGCYSNVMGLSLPWLKKELLKKGILL
tara:strand:+ start:6968 stop:7588 length:621 start_codon:yes stop_codon:yes gene_type:complete